MILRGHSDCTIFCNLQYSDCTLSVKYFRFPRYIMKCSGKHDTTWNIPHSIVTVHCPKSISAFRDILWNVVENMILHEIFRVVPRFPHYISCYKAENHFLWDSVYTQQWTMNMGWTWDFSWHCPFNVWMCRMTKCTFHKYGGSGTIQKFDALCVLGMNIINEKVSFNFFYGRWALALFPAFAAMPNLPQVWWLWHYTGVWCSLCPGYEHHQPEG